MGKGAKSPKYQNYNIFNLRKGRNVKPCQVIYPLIQPQTKTMIKMVIPRSHKIKNQYIFDEIVAAEGSTTFWILETGVSISYVWEILITPSIESPPLKAQFSTYYTALGSENESTNLDMTTRKFTYNLDIVNYQTLYIVEIDVQPTKGNEFCRVGALCNLNLCIKPDGHTLNAVEIETSLMYEVLAEPTVWAVCGRTAGVVSFETDMEPQIVVLEVMPLNNGFLPLPLVRLSKYIPADASTADKTRKGGESHPRLEPFSPGQVYNVSKGHQVHVIAGTVAETTAT